MEFWGYYRMFRRRRWLIIGAMLAAVTVAVVINRIGIGEYEASATLSIPSEQRAFFVFGGSDQSAGDVRTQLALNLLRSRDLAERVVRRLHLGLRPEDLQRRLRVEKDPGGRLVRVFFTGTTRADAITLTNAFAEEAAAYDQEVQSRESTLAREFVEKQVDAARTNLRNAEDALLQFRQKNEFVLASAASQQVANLETVGQGVALSLSEINAKLSSIRAQMTGQTATRSEQEITDSPIAGQLRAQLVGLEIALTSELAVHTEKYYTVPPLKAKIQAIKDRLNSELGKIVSSEKVQHNPVYDALAQQRITLEADRVALLAKKEALARMVGVVHQNLPGLAQVQMEQSRLARNIDTLEKEYADLQTRLGQARLREQGILDLGSMAVADHARAARPAPLQGKLARLSLAALLGVMAGGGLAYFLDYLDNGLNTAENAERLLGVPALAAIPRHNPPFVEAYRMLQASLAAYVRGRAGATVIAATSARPGAGTSTVVANLARAFAHVGWRTLVIDAGLHRPVQHIAFGVRAGKGLAELLAGNATVPETLAETDIPNLWVLPGGADPVKMNGLLSSPAFARQLDDLKWRFDVILLDTPPVGAFADALNMAPLTSGVLLVFDARQAPRGVEERVKSQLDRVGAKILGSVLTRVRPDLVDSYVYQEHLNTPKHRWMPSRTAATAVGAAVLVVVLGVLAGLSVKAAQNAGILSSIWTTSAQLVSATARQIGELLTTIEHVVAQWFSRALPALAGWMLGGRAP